MNNSVKNDKSNTGSGAIKLAIPMLIFAAMALGGSAIADEAKKKPITLDRSGGFAIGGKVIVNPEDPGKTLSCDHGYVEYFLPAKPRKTSLVMWHSSSSQGWQNRWDGGEGYKDKFLRRDYPVYLWDGPRVGRANWSCEPINYVPAYRDQGNFTAWLFGPLPPVGAPKPSDFFPGVQFPVKSAEAWNQATRARYDEFDTGANIQLQTDVAAVAADSGKLGDRIVYLTNSAGGLRAMVTTSKATEKNIAGIVTYESIGYVFPEGDPEAPPACTDPGPACAFGPIHVPLKDFKKLAKLKGIQFVWGDNRPETDRFGIQSRIAAKLINKYGGNAEVLVLGRDAGLTGSTHIPFADLDNEKVAGLLDKFLKKNKLDLYRKK